MSIPSPPRDLGQRLLPTVVDEIARSDPHRVLYSIPRTRHPRDGFHDISAAQFSRAVDRCAWHLHRELGPGVNFPTVLYIGPQDIVYALLTLACIKTGHRLLLTSPRNTLDAHLFLARETGCSAMLVPPAFPLPVIGKILEAASLRAVDLPDAVHWMVDGPVDAYPYHKTYAEARLQPWVVLHTSGSTGMPKPIVQTHATYSPLDAYTALPSLGYPDTYPSDSKGRRVYLGFPLFHCGGISMLLPCSIFGRFTIVLGPFPPSPEVIQEIHVHGNVQESLIAPSTLVDMAKDPAYLEGLSRLERVVFGGGTLPKEVGDIINSRTVLASVLGTTEAGVVPLDPCDREDWAYMKVSPVLGVEYRQVSEDLYEQVIVRKPELQLYQPVFGTFPHLQEWPMKDLYSKHPTKDNVWLYRGRADDIIVYTTGEKLNPVDMEAIIQAHPAVKGAIICGMGQFQSSLLVEAVEPAASDAERERLLDEIWPFIENANKESPSHGRIHRDMILFTTADRPMPRAGKGTIQRQATVALYKTDLDNIYAASEVVSSANGRVVTPGEPADISEVVKTILSGATDISANDISTSVNLFDFGLDSLQVATIVKNVNKHLATLGKPLLMDQRLVYSNPSLNALTDVVTALCKGNTPMSSGKTAVENMQHFYDLNVSHLPITARAPQPQAGEISVLLTGSTGSLGSYVLDSLIRESKVTRIFCLNRGPGSLERQHKSHAIKGLSALPSKVTCLDGSLSQDYFGLTVEEYKTLLRSVGLVIHNAWQVNFNLPLESFSAHVASVRRLVDFSSHSRLGARIFFVSSISSVANYSAAARDGIEAVPEQIIEDWRVVDDGGYGQSKLISERVLDAAAKHAGVPTAVCRVGQIAGPTTAAGLWPKQEWFPSLVASSKHLGKLPASLGKLDQVDWIPVDLLGRGVVELALGPWSAGELEPEPEPRPPHGALVYHAVNPKPAAWADLVPVLQAALGGVGVAEIVPLETWVEALEDSASKTGNVDENPAVKLLHFFQGLTTGVAVRLETERTVRSAPALAALTPVQAAWVENWARQWSF